MPHTCFRHHCKCQSTQVVTFRGPPGIQGPPGGPGTNVLNVIAGTTNGNLGTLAFVNSNGISFGLSGSTITASGGGGGNGSINFSAGTTSNSLSNVIFSNSNGLAFGLNGSTITGSYTVPSTAGLISAINVSAGTTSHNLTNIVLSNSNGASFGLNGSTITVSYTVPSTAGLISDINISAGTTSGNVSAVTYLNSNNVSFGYDGTNITASVNTSLTAINLSAGTTSNNLSAFTLSNSNNVSFGLNGSVITATATVNIPAQTNQTVGLYGLGNTTQNSSTTLDARSLSFNGLGIVTVGYSNGSIQLSATTTQSVQTQNVVVPSAGTQTATSGTVVFANSNGISFGMSGSSQITASYTVPSTAGLLSAINVSAGTTSNNLSAFTLSNSNNVSFGLNGSTITATATFNQTNQSIGLYGLGNTTQNSSTTLDARSLSFNGLGIITVGYSNGSIQLSATTPTQTNQTVGLYGLGNTTQNSSTTLDARSLSLNGLGIITVGYSNGSIQLSATQSNQTEGWYAAGNTVGQSSSTTRDARSISISGAGIASVGYSNGDLIISVGAAGASVNFSAGTTSNNLAAVTFSNSNGVSFGLNASTITASIATSLTAINISAGTTSNNLSAITFSNSNGISFGLNASTITASYTVPTQTNQTVGLYALGNTTQNSSTTLDARSISLNGLGAVTVGYSNGSVQISAPTRQVSLLSVPESPFQTNFTISNASLSWQHFNAKNDITMTQANLLMALNGHSNSTGALTISLAIYTMLHSTMSMASSNSQQLSWTSGSSTTVSSAYGGVSGTQYRTVSLNNWSVTAGDYMLGMWFRTTNDGTWLAFGSEGPTIVNALDVNQTQAYLNGYSVSSFTTAMAGSANVTDTNYVRTGGDALKQPGVIFMGSF